MARQVYVVPLDSQFQILDHESGRVLATNLVSEYDAAKFCEASGWVRVGHPPVMGFALPKAAAEQMIQSLRKVAADCEMDSIKREGMLINGRTIATALGEICAQIHAVATILALFIEKHETP